MRKLSYLMAAASVCIFASVASAQQTPTNPQTTPAVAVQVPTAADTAEVNRHITSAPVVTDVTFRSQSDVESRNYVGESIGSRYGTREPRTCNSHKASMSDADAREFFICDAEHEFGGSLYLVSDVSLLVSTPRAFNSAEDSSKPSIDAGAQVYDIRANYNNYQCSKIPSSYLDYPGNRNCNQFKMTNAAGSCFKNTAGEWHCLMYDFHTPALATATNVHAPLGEQ